MLAPGVDQNDGIIRQRDRDVIDDEIGVCAANLEQHVAMGMGMAHERVPQFNESNPAKTTQHDTYSCRHDRTIAKSLV
ncbi:hypothetical protein D3C72_2433690 [compost metagenome]